LLEFGQFRQFSAVANESHFSKANKHLKSLDYTSVSFSDLCNKVTF